VDVCVWRRVVSVFDPALAGGATIDAAEAAATTGDCRALREARPLPNLVNLTTLNSNSSSTGSACRGLQFWDGFIPRVPALLRTEFRAGTT
jgi:hypothetical protein